MSIRKIKVSLQAVYLRKKHCKILKKQTDMAQVHNFNAGPCVLPRQAVESAIEAIRNFDNTGVGILEISHRTPGWERIMAETEQ